MNDDAFARRFYADRAELESLGIELKVDKPAEGYYEAENYTLPPENFYLRAIEFTDAELGALRTALSLLDGEFAYAEPLRLALQQLSWGKPSPLRRPGAELGRARGHGGRGRPRALAAAVEDRDGDLPAQDDRVRLLHARPRRAGVAPRRSLPPALPRRPVLPRRLLARARRRARVPPLAHPRQGRLRVEGRARLLRPRGLRPARLLDAHRLAARRPPVGTARIWISDRIDWLVERHFGHAGTITPAADADDAPDDGVVFETEYADPRQIVAWVLGLGERARILSPSELRRRGRRARAADRPPPRGAAGARSLARTRSTASSAGRAARERQARDADPAGALRAARDARRDPDRGCADGLEVERQARSARASS